MRKLATFLVLTCLAVGVTACHFSLKTRKAKGQKVTVTNQDVNVRPFEEIVMAGGFDVTYRQGDTATVRIQGPADILEKIDVRSDGRTLFIGPNKKNKLDILKVSRQKVKIEVTSVDLTSVQIAGSGEFSVQGAVDTDRLEVAIAGSGEAHFPDLICNELNGSVAGSGDLFFKKVAVGWASFSIAGSGDVEAHLATCNKLSVDIAGSGDMKLSGRTVEYHQSIAGSGGIDKEGLVVGN